MTLDLGLSGATAIVTGASAGIGQAVSAMFTAEGAVVIGVDITAPDRSDDSIAHYVAGDVADPPLAEEAARTALAATGRIDILVNCAGIVDHREGFLSYEAQDWQRVWNVNVLGYVNMSRAVLPAMLEQQAGALVHLGSVRSRLPVPTQVVYASTKAAVASLSKSLALEFGSVGIRSNVVSPGAVRTPLWDRPGGLGDVFAKMHGLPRDEAISHELTTVRKIPAGRAATPTEVASAVLFMASPIVSGYVNGADLLVDGAMTPSV